MEQITVLAAEFDRRAERIEELTAEVERLSEKLRLSGIRERSYRDQFNAAEEAVDAARELIAAEDEMYQLDAEWDEMEDRDCDFTSRQACLDRAIAGRHECAQARRTLVALLEATDA